MRRTTTAGIVLALGFGALAGAAAYTFQYAKGLSYFSNDPRSCVNCHVMNEQYDGWLAGSHHGAAVCNDCHMPHALVPKMVTKARNGWNHSKAFTLMNFPEPIQITVKNKAVLEANCRSCHADMVSPLTDAHGGFDLERGCTHCHLHSGHGPVR